MKKTIFILLIVALTHTNSMQPAIGCMDKSYHVKKKYDYKVYHYVQCNCPCHKYVHSFDRGICPQCGHYHDPGEFNVLAPAATEKATEKTNMQLKKIIEHLKNGIKTVSATQKGEMYEKN